jgi:hypothetical protein
MSVVIATPHSFETLRKLIDELRGQTASDRLEVVIVAASRERLKLDESLLQGFHSYQVIEVGPFESIATPRAVGVRAARAPVVALAEDHAYPAPGWARALIEAHRQPWAAVGPAILNANPQTRISRTDLLLCYGPFVAPARSGIVPFVAGDNSTYKRELLLGYGDRLEAMLEDEGALHRDLRAQGFQLYLEASAQTRHLNFARLSPWLSLRYHGGRLYGARRAQENHWSLPRRLIYIATSPLFPLVQVWQLIATMQRAGRQPGMVWRFLPELAAALVAGVAGEVAGYAWGPGDSLDKLTSLRFRREEHAP